MGSLHGQTLLPEKAIRAKLKRVEMLALPVGSARQHCLPMRVNFRVVSPRLLARFKEMNHTVNKIHKVIVTLTSVLLLSSFSACNSSSAIVTGSQRPPIDISQVKVYSEKPQRYEVIALIEAMGKTGWTDQKKTSGAIEALKAKAASLGANGVLIEKVSDGNRIYQGTSVSEKKVEGKAIWVH